MFFKKRNAPYLFVPLFSSVILICTSLFRSVILICTSLFRSVILICTSLFRYMKLIRRKLLNTVFCFLIPGTYVDPSIVPGFSYRVRVLGRKKTTYLFDGEALTLRSIGIGYGKRISFTSHSLNFNSNYFWSDNNTEGYGFELVSRIGDTFSLHCPNLERSIAEATVISLDILKETDMTVTDTKNIEKHVICDVTLNVEYEGEPHGVLSLRHPETIRLQSSAVLSKARGQRSASLTHLDNVTVPGYGVCCLYPLTP